MEREGAKAEQYYDCDDATNWAKGASQDDRWSSDWTTAGREMYRMDGCMNERKKVSLRPMKLHHFL